MMQTIQIHSRVGADGILKLALPLGPSDANTNVVITIQSLPEPAKSCQNKSWQDFIEATYGSCAELGLERGPQRAIEYL